MLSVSLWTTQHHFTVTREEKGGKYYYYWRRSWKCFRNVSYSNSTGRKCNTTLIAIYIWNTQNAKYIIKRTITNRCGNIFWQSTSYERLKYFSAWLPAEAERDSVVFSVSTVSAFCTRKHHTPKPIAEAPGIYLFCSCSHEGVTRKFTEEWQKFLFFLAPAAPSYLIVGFSRFHAVFQVSDQGVDQTWMFPHRLSVALLCAA